MILDKQINELLEINESFKAPTALNEKLKDEQTRIKLFDDFLKFESDLSYDWFNSYFQEEQADRKNKKQDFTPDKITKLISSIVGTNDVTIDLCAGTGGLTIAAINENKDGYFYCEEFSERAFPFLIFNLAIRNVNALVKRGDSLTNEYAEIFKLTKGDKYSSIIALEEVEEISGSVVMNPPYSLSRKNDDGLVNNDAFKGYELPPKSKSDFGFLLQGLNKLDDNGKMVILLPHGVLFRGAKEEKIRKQLIDNNLIDAVIGLPGNLFLNTSIPTAIIVLAKNKTTDDILFIDASNDFDKEKAFNVLNDEHIKKIVTAYHDRKDIDKYAHVATFNEIEENDFNLNIPRYVDTFEEEPEISLKDLSVEMADTQAKIIASQNEVLTMMHEITATDTNIQAELDEFISVLEGGSRHE